MKTKLNKVLLIDDDAPTNFLHQEIFEEVDCAEEIVIMQRAQEALDYLITPVEGKYPNPELIFLDINMPGMNGWEFLDVYQKLAKKFQGEIIVMMLTTSLNPDDYRRANTMEAITGLINKPLTKDRLLEVLRAYFPELAVAIS